MSIATPYQPPAPPLQVAQWFNTPEPLSLEALRGRVVVLHAFQMLCPGCVEQGIPQARRVHEAFSHDQVVVIGLHTVFEHHAVQGTAAALAAFIHEYRLRFPIALDQPHATRGIPLTMQALMLQGTPSLVVLDREGRVRLHHFGHLDDLRLGALLGQLLAEPTLPGATAQPAAGGDGAGCDDQGCPRPDMPRP
ncbi:MAG: redoxin family protein [Proteobacteria bacterium]|nr:redoxin family protein [Pseudomonadota bacterium]